MVISAFTALVAVGAAPAQAVPLIGVVGPRQLVGFDSATPGVVTNTLDVTGLGRQFIRGIDFRPSTGQLYGVTEAGSLFTVNTGTGAATVIGVAPNLGGPDFGFAFNPVPDAIRVVNVNQGNVRVNPGTAATTVDGNLAFAATDVNAGVRSPAVTGVAYTNQNAGPQTSTILYGIDANTESLVTLNAPNTGVLNTVGALGLNVANFRIGFDIDGASNTAFASFVLEPTNAPSLLYTINLGTGAATLIGSFGGVEVRDIAVGSIGAATAVPEPASLAILGLGLAGLLAGRRKQPANKSGSNLY